MINKVFLYLSEKQNIRKIFFNIIMAIAYGSAMYFSHSFHSIFGEITCVWFACSILLPLIWIHGQKIITGVIIGAFIGLIFTVPSLPLITQITFVGTHALTDIAQPIIIIYLLKKLSHYQYIFTNFYSVWLFILASFLAPFVSAWIGATAMLFSGLINYSEYGTSIISWWLSYSIAYLSFSPVIIMTQEINLIPKKAKALELFIFLFIFALTCVLIFKVGYELEYLLFLILFWSAFRLSSLSTSFLVSVVSLTAILATAKGYGVFTNQPLFYLQSFLVTFAVTGLILVTVLSEKNIIQLTLWRTLDSLEVKVAQRTKDLEKTQHKLEEANKVLREMINIDGLTQIANRRCFDNRLQAEWQRLYRSGEVLSLLLIDIDYFKTYNDNYGHQQGDECLVRVAQVLKYEVMRSSDLVARYGGEEFAILLPNTELQGAIAVAKKLHDAIANLNIRHQYSQVAEQLTISIGISTIVPEISQPATIVVRQADQALYLAKERGRNQSAVYANTSAQRQISFKLQ